MRLFSLSVVVLGLAVLIAIVLNTTDGDHPSGESSPAPATTGDVNSNGTVSAMELPGPHFKRERIVPYEANPRALDQAPCTEGTLRVLVVDQNDEPVSGMRVAFYRLFRNETISLEPSHRLPSGWDQADQRTDENGMLVHAGLESGEWIVSAGLDGRQPYHFARFELSKSESAFVQITIEPAPSDRAISGTVFGPDGAPLAGASVEYCWTDSAGINQKLVSFSKELDGQFVLLPPADARKGALRSAVHKSRKRSAALSNIDAGTGGHELHMGPPLFVELIVRSAGNLPIKSYFVNFHYQLAGQWVKEYPAPKRRVGEPILLGVPTVPFRIGVHASGYKNSGTGPVDPSTVGSVLVVHLEPDPHISGRVTVKGVPVANAAVTLWNVDADSGRGGGSTDEQGFFDFACDRAGTYELRGWSDEHGKGNFGPLEFSGEPIGGIKLELAEAAATIRGRVFFPDGHDSSEVLITSSQNSHFITLEADGSYELPSMPAGPCTVFVRDSWGGFKQPPGIPFRMSYPPTQAPSWLKLEATYFVDLEPGEVRVLDIDLAGEPLCGLVGRLDLGSAVLRNEDGSGSAGSSSALLSLEAREFYVARASFERGEPFRIGSQEAGKFRLNVGATLADESVIYIQDRVELAPGAVNWHFATEFGEVRILPAPLTESSESGPKPTSLHSDQYLQWRGAGDLKAQVRYGHVNESTGVQIYRHVPTGAVEVFNRKSEDPIGRLTVAVGKRVDFQMP